MNALHDPDQIAGGYADLVTGMGSASMNEGIGSQWRTRIGALDQSIRENVVAGPAHDWSSFYLNIQFERYPSPQ